jgi:hypothetical protein
MIRFLLLFLAILCFNLDQVLAQNEKLDSLESDTSRWKVKRISAAYAGENLIRPGMQLSADFIPIWKKKHELVLSPTLTFFVFRPFYTSVMIGGRATYHIHFPSGLTIRPLGLGLNYKHKFLLAPVYEVNNGNVEKTRNDSYGNIHALATTGLAYNFSDRTSLPLSLFADFGFSAEPYFGVFKFHYEIFIGVSYHLK